jgi:hypothetical protein
MTPANRVTPQPPPPAAARGPAPVHCAVGDTLCEVRVLDADQWAALPQDRRPSAAEYVPGLGWVVALPPGRWAD